MNREVHFTTTQGAMSSTAVVPKYRVKEVRTLDLKWVHSLLSASAMFEWRVKAFE